MNNFGLRCKATLFFEGGASEGAQTKIIHYSIFIINFSEGKP